MKLTEPVTYRPADAEDLESIMLIVRQAKNYLRKNRVDQWQGEYPAQRDILDAIEKGECYCLMYANRVAGFFCVTETPEKCYDEITDGKWRYDGKYCTIHRCAVEATFRGTGISDMMFKFCEEIAIEKGAGAMRIDTHRKNKAMHILLKRMGYSYRGNVLVSSEPGHDPARHAFEKKL